MELSTYTLLKVIHYCNDNPYQLAHLLKISSENIFNWLDEKKQIDLKTAKKMEKLTNHLVSRYDLAPQFRPQGKNPNMKIKFILQYGIYHLVELLQKKQISVKVAAQIASLPPPVQEQILLSNSH